MVPKIAHNQVHSYILTVFIIHKHPTIPHLMLHNTGSQYSIIKTYTYIGKIQQWRWNYFHLLSNICTFAYCTQQFWKDKNVQWNLVYKTEGLKMCFYLPNKHPDFNKLHFPKCYSFKITKLRSVSCLNGEHSKILVYNRKSPNPFLSFLS